MTRDQITKALNALAQLTPATDPAAVAWMHSRKEWENLRSAVALSLKFPSMESFPGIPAFVLPLIEKILLLDARPPGQPSQGSLLGDA